MTELTLHRYGSTKKTGSTGVDRCILPSDFTHSSITHDLKSNFQNNKDLSESFKKLSADIAKLEELGKISEEFENFEKIVS